MPICVECTAPVDTLYNEYGKGNIRLTQCKKCKKFADKYIEHDFVVIFMDMILHKPQVYRHVLFNRLDYQGAGIDPTVSKLAILLILFDVYIKWFRIENYHTTGELPLMRQPLQMQYISMLLVCIIDFITFHLVVRFAVYQYFRRSGMDIRLAIFPPSVLGCALPRRRVWLLFICQPVPARDFNSTYHARYNYMSMALIISSFGELLFVLMVIWDYDELDFSWLINLVVVTSNTQALAVFLNLGYAKTLCLLLAGVLAAALVDMYLMRVLQWYSP